MKVEINKLKLFTNVSFILMSPLGEKLITDFMTSPLLVLERQILSNIFKVRNMERVAVLF